MVQTSSNSKYPYQQFLRGRRVIEGPSPLKLYGINFLLSIPYYDYASTPNMGWSTQNVWPKPLRQITPAAQIFGLTCAVLWLRNLHLNHLWSSYHFGSLYFCNASAPISKTTLLYPYIQQTSRTKPRRSRYYTISSVNNILHLSLNINDSDCQHKWHKCFYCHFSLYYYFRHGLAQYGRVTNRYGPGQLFLNSRASSCLPQTHSDHESPPGNTPTQCSKLNMSPTASVQQSCEGNFFQPQVCHFLVQA